MEYNEQSAIKLIRSKVPSDALRGVDDDEILNVIDIIWDFYEEKGMLDLSAEVDDEEEVSFDELVAYVKKVIAKDKKSPIDVNCIPDIVSAELEYEDSIEEDF